MSEPIDKLIFALDGDLTALKARYAEAEADAAKTGTKINAALNAPLKSAANDAAASANKIKQAMGDVAGAVDKSHASVNMATREFRALFDELSSGRTRMVPGTLAIIATRVFGLTGTTLAWGAAILAIPAAFAVAAAQAEASLARIRQALILTNNASGMTLSGVVEASKYAGQQSGASIGRTEGISASLLSQYVPGADIQRADVAEVQAERSGFSTQSAEKMLAQMFEDPSKAAAELNDKMHLLTVAQTDQVEALQRSGETQKAGELILQVFSDRTKEAANSASFFSKMLSNAGLNLGTFWNKLGTLFTGGTDQDKLAQMQQALSEAMQIQAAVKKGYDPMQGGAGNQKVSNGMIWDQALSILPAQINALEAKMLQEGNAAGQKASADAADQDLKRANAIAKSYDVEGEHAQKLQEQLATVNKELEHTGGEHAQYRAQLQKTAQALKDAIDAQKTQTPEALAAQEAANARVLAHTPVAQRPVVEAQQRAEAERLRNLANPQTALQADSIYQSQMSVAGIDKTSAATEKLSAEQTKNLQIMQEEAAGSLRLADAYKVSTAAAMAQKALDDASKEVVSKKIADERAYAQALIVRTAAQEAATEAEKLNQQSLQQEANKRIIAGGGSPFGTATAEAQNKALSDTQKERDAAAAQLQLAKTDTERAAALAAVARAQDDYNKSLASYTAQAQQAATISANKLVYGAQTSLKNTQQTAAAVQGGASDDDLRHLQVMQETLKSLVDTGLDPASQKFRDMEQTLVPLNLQMSDLTTAMQKIQQASSDFASAITGPLGHALDTGSFKGFGRAVGQNVIGAATKNFVTDPLNGALKSGFSSVFGGLGKPDGTMQNPLYVAFSPTAGLLGNGSSNLLPNNGAGSGGLLSTIGNFFAGLFSGGGDIPSGQWGIVGENGPEPVRATGAGIQVRPNSSLRTLSPTARAPQLSAPSVSAPASTFVMPTATMHFSVDVRGAQGDKQITDFVHQSVATGVTEGLKSYDKNLNRTLPNRQASLNRRQLK